MLLYRLADDTRTRDSALLPPRMSFAPGGNRDSVMSSASSILSLSSDSKYPSGLPATRGYVAYAYDPADDDGPPDEDDLLHDPREKMRKRTGWLFPWRGFMNVGLLVMLVLALMALFVFYPMWRFFRDKAVNERIDGNIRINATGQAPVLFQMPELIDTDTPDEAKTRTGFDGQEYELVFSDEFNVDGRSFYPGDDPFWEAVDLWYGATADLEWYDPQQVTTRDGALVITMDSTTPFTTDENHGQTYRSGMLQSWNKFCFTTGYIEISATFPGPDEDTQGYWPGAWTMGNLARPGYAATTDGMWPYTYDSCDVGTFPNQTNPDGLGPAAALHSDASRSKYNFELSWLSGQRTSACSCPNSDHPGPSTDKGRGAPEIDIFEAEKDKEADHGQVASLSSQFAPFSHDYVYPNDTQDEWWIYNTSSTRPNTYKGSAVQQAVSALAKLPSDMFQGSGANFKTLVGFEYWSDPSDRGAGYITWQVDGSATHRLGAAAVGPDQGADGSGVDQRLISEEPMSVVLNLGISQNWQTIDLTTMIFPAELKFDYVRVYQRKGQSNVGCNPKDYPTMDYINNHLEAYQNPNVTTWSWPKPTNSLVRPVVFILAGKMADMVLDVLVCWRLLVQS
ncbi:beta-glucan synthesis-associated [Cyathus striatus]|nr:beta-glucan synthesis-associated [Cyathus striatus]